MTAIFDQTLGAMVAAPAGTKVAPEAESVVARMAQLAFDVASSAGKGELMRALSTGSSVAFLRVFAELLVSASGPSTAAMEALRGRLSLAEAVELSGGLWRADEAQAALGVARATLHAWRDGGRDARAVRGVRRRRCQGCGAADRRARPGPDAQRRDADRPWLSSLHADRLRPAIGAADRPPAALSRW